MYLKVSIVNYISSLEVAFLRRITAQFNPNMKKLVFQFLGQDEIEPNSTTSKPYHNAVANDPPSPHYNDT